MLNGRKRRNKRGRKEGIKEGSEGGGEGREEKKEEGGRETREEERKRKEAEQVERGALVLAMWHLSESAHPLPSPSAVPLVLQSEGNFEQWECFTYPRSPLEKSIELLSTCNGLAPFQNIGFCCPCQAGLSMWSLDSAFAHTCLAQGVCWAVKGRAGHWERLMGFDEKENRHTGLIYNPFQLLLCWGKLAFCFVGPFSVKTAVKPYSVK